jgi:5-methylcytosine-specific restriction protein B
MAFIYSWLPAYQQIIAKLPEYRDRQLELIQVLRDIEVNVNDDEDVRGVKSPLTEIDPFTFLFFLGKAKTNWVGVVRKLCGLWNIDVKVNDVCGLPSPNAQKLWMFPYKYDRTNEIADLWGFFNSAYRETINEPQFANILKINSVGLQKMTEGLFMVKPDRYLCLNGKVKPYLQSLGINTDFENYTQLEAIYASIRAEVPLSFHEISFKGYIDTTTKDHIPSYFRVGTKEGELGESQLPDMIANNIVSIGWRDIGDLNDLEPFNKGSITTAFTNAGYQSAKNVQSRKAGEIIVFKNDISAGDFVLAADGASIKAIGKVISDHYVYEDTLLFAHCRCVEWLVTNIEDLSVNEGLRTSVWKYEYEQSIEDIKNYLSQAKEKKILFEQYKIKSIISNMALNRILFGPPGTGKTFHSISHAVAIVEGKKFEDVIDERESKVVITETLSVKARYDKYVDEGLITFCTFHQSMSYEDFIEGIKPIKPRVDETYLKYDVEDGIFKEICTKASASLYGINLKLSAVNAEGIGNTATADQRFADYVNSNPVGKILFSRTGKIYTCRSANDREIIISSDNKDNATFSKEVVIKGLEYYTKRPSLPKIKEVHDNVRSLDSSIFDSLIRAIFEIESGETTGQPSANSITNSSTNQKRFVLIIDEINRGNVSQVFGELITLIEDDKRLGKEEALTATLPYSGDDFGVPPNLYIIGTMNTADRSVEALDTALRRRFTFVPMLPEETKLKSTSDGIDLPKMLKALNSRLKILKDADHTIGHAWLMNVTDEASLVRAFANKVLPLLQEYFYNDYEKLGMLLGEKFFKKPTTVDDKTLAKFFGSSLSSQYENAEQYQLEDADKLTKDAFLSIYQ